MKTHCLLYVFVLFSWLRKHRKYLPTMKSALKMFDYLSSCVAGSLAEAATSLNGRRGLRFSLILPPLSISKDQQGILPLVQHPLHRSHPPNFDLSIRTLPNNKDQNSAKQQRLELCQTTKIGKGYFFLILPLVQHLSSISVSFS